MVGDQDRVVPGAVEPARPIGACVAHADLRRDDAGGLRFLDGTYAVDGPEHAAGTDATLCGLPIRDVLRMRHHFNARSPLACPTCASALAQ